MTTTTPPAEAVIEVQELTTRFGPRLVHDRVSLTVYRGEVLAIVGGSGSGKTTLLREIIMLQRPNAGSIRVLGEDVLALGEREALVLRRRLGVLFQQGALFGGLTVLENVSAPLKEHTKLSRSLISEIAALKIALTGLPPESAALYPSQLSGGMRKRAALARAIALDPELLFLDEPTSGLDPLGADALDQLVLQLKASLGSTMVIVTHDLNLLWRVPDRVVLLGGAHILGEGSMEQLAGSTNGLVQAFFQGPRGRAARAQAWNRK
jgi:phospholipid/cholesterol/gamma-HCH transport system ATP-binding protein